MPQGLTLPGALSRVLAPFRPCFTAPTFAVFTALVAEWVPARSGLTRRAGPWIDFWNPTSRVSGAHRRV